MMSRIVVAEVHWLAQCLSEETAVACPEEINRKFASDEPRRLPE